MTGYNFGNGYYNDHHFHYGYWIYTTAAPWQALEDSRLL